MLKHLVLFSSMNYTFIFCNDQQINEPLHEIWNKAAIILLGDIIYQNIQSTSDQDKLDD